MGLLDRFTLFDERGDGVVSVIPYHHNGTYNVKGHNSNILRHIDQIMTLEELETFKETHHLRHEHELGQLTIEDMIQW